MMYCINVWNEIDIFMIQRQDHLIVADYESRYFEVDLLLSKTVSDDIVWKVNLSANGMPEITSSYNRPPFVSKDFKYFMKTWEISHHTYWCQFQTASCRLLLMQEYGKLWRISSWNKFPENLRRFIGPNRWRLGKILWGSLPELQCGVLRNYGKRWR